MSTTTYLSVVNDAIKEAGLDLASFAVDGSDWTTNTNAMMQRIKGWVARAWQDIQQNAYDLSFMEEIAVVNINPGVLFYTDGTSVIDITAGLSNTNINVYDQDNTVAISAIPATTFTDLTGEFTDTAPFGYFNVNATGTSQISWALKPAAEYFKRTNLSVVTLTKMTQNNVIPDLSVQVTLQSSTPFIETGYVTSVEADGTGTYTVTMVFGFNTSFVVGAPQLEIVQLASPFTNYYTYTGSTVATSNFSATRKAFVHGWKSFSFAEETGIPGFQETIQEIDQQSFRMVDYYNPAPSGEYPLQFMEWESFNKIYDLSSTYPGLPRLITEDNTGRWRLYPHPYYNVTLKFDYDRVPQIVSAFGDTFFGLPDDFTNMVMWKALIYYGEYDEQPSVAARATKYYKTMLNRFETKFREKFHFKPHRMY